MKKIERMQKNYAEEAILKVKNSLFDLEKGFIELKDLQMIWIVFKRWKQRKWDQLKTLGIV